MHFLVFVDLAKKLGANGVGRFLQKTCWGNWGSWG
jgi:hypothetical protein